MVDYEDDETLQELHDEMYSIENEKPKRGTTQFGQTTKFAIGIFVAATVLLIMFNKLSMSQGVLILAAGGIIIYLTSGPTIEKNELSYIECIIRLHDTLKFLQKHPIGDVPQIPKGEINITPIGRKQIYEGKAYKRSFGVKIWDQHNDLEEIYLIEVDIFTGDILSVIHKPEGVWGDETKDIKYIAPYDMLLQKKRDQYLQKSYKWKIIG